MSFYINGIFELIANLILTNSVETPRRCIETKTTKNNFSISNSRGWVMLGLGYRILNSRVIRSSYNAIWEWDGDSVASILAYSAYFVNDCV